MGGPTRTKSPDPIVEKLRNIRTSRGLTQRAVAELAGLGQPALSDIEVGKNTPTLTTLRRLADALGYDLAIVPRGEQR